MEFILPLGQWRAAIKIVKVRVNIFWTFWFNFEKICAIYHEDAIVEQVFSCVGAETLGLKIKKNNMFCVQDWFSATVMILSRGQRSIKSQKHPKI